MCTSTSFRSSASRWSRPSIRDGRVLVLRPDVTLPIVETAAREFPRSNQLLKLRLRQHGLCANITAAGRMARISCRGIEILATSAPNVTAKSSSRQQNRQSRRRRKHPHRHRYGRLYAGLVRWPSPFGRAERQPSRGIWPNATSWPASPILRPCRFRPMPARPWKPCWSSSDTMPRP